MSFSSEDSLLDRSALEARAEDLLADIYNKLGPMVSAKATSTNECLRLIIVFSHR